ncbi:ATP-binding cassette domain-containing protein [Paucilactobacillus suebicus]|uniref:ABC transporter ATPase n=1 Tax=Paucilactobacillus suebicus DSM 5007 = KCTC 3549 TaxID=1423807 RepID=A0A0R1VZQ4_9LACO|nr:ATP-binding cassette domain-containing protein [Paucilactobacillus suebicus]KRM09339.1 ABC transporter ATPase [Paucilactobacillus suebicus DSM 5007 = KCTC 3549]
MAQIIIRKVKKIVDGRVLFDANALNAQTGDVVGVVGGNGSGKTTLMNMIMGLDSDYQGNINTDGQIEFVPQINAQNDRSGGQTTSEKIRVAVAKWPEILILDEPTSNLDENHQHQLIKTVENYSGLTIIISRDRHFLNAVTSKIWSVEDNHFTEYNDNFDEFELRQNQEFKRRMDEYARQKDYQSSIRRAVEERKQKAAHIRKGSKNMGRIERAQTKSIREQNAGKMERSAHAMLKKANSGDANKPFQVAPIKLMVTDFPKFTGKTLASATQLKISFDHKILIDNGTFKIKPGDKVALVGPNGSGKTTLIKSIINRQNYLNVSDNARIGYFNQDLTALPLEDKVLNFVQKDSRVNDDRLRQVMGAFGITHAYYDKQIAHLSGGQKVKVQLLKVLLGANNFLVLDEPTNFLDMSAIDALASFIEQYPGSVLFVSHDQGFRNRVARRTLLITKCQLVDPAIQSVNQKVNSDLPLLKMRYDQLIQSGNGDPQEISAMKAKINRLTQ